MSSGQARSRPTRRPLLVTLAACLLLVIPVSLSAAPTDASFTSAAVTRSSVTAAVMTQPSSLTCTENFVLLVGTSSTVSWTAPAIQNPNIQYEVSVTQGNNTDSYLLASGTTSTVFSPGLLGLGGLIRFLFVAGPASVSVSMVAVNPQTDEVTWRSAPSTRTVRVALPLLGLIGGFFCS
ncbi:MAG: hypothetical protein ACTJHU_05500 [Mycetocola sp.]